MVCPKCSAEEKDVARFCRRCHATLRYRCPACAHEQRHGGSCDECGVNFAKYLTGLVAAKKADADAIRDRLERRSTLIKNLLWTPFTLGLPLVRALLFDTRESRRR
jgi:hypothetical protein